MVFVYRRDLYIQDADLWLDPHKNRPFAFISHGHGDHLGRHEHTLATPETARIIEHRLGKQNITQLPWGETVDVGGGVNVRALPAGHILGSAQLEVVARDTRLVFSGDFRLARGETTRPCEVVPCDILVMECTYGQAHYKFPPREEVVPKLAADLQGVLESGGTPILLSYTLGRSQELLKLLEPYDFKIQLAPPIFSMVRLYQQMGIEFGANFSYAKPGGTDGAVVFVPPHASKSRLVKQSKNPTLIAATGWAVDGQKGPPYPTDRSYPISDHADFDELKEYVRRAKPKVVYTMHGFVEFYEFLREEGVRAYPVEERVAMS